MEQNQNHWKNAFVTLIIIVLGTVLLVGGWLFAQSKVNSKQTSQITPTQSASTTTDNPATQTAGADSGIPLTKNTVSFTRDNNNVYLQYKGKIYEEDQNGQPQQATISLPNATWYGLVNTPEIATGFDEIFSFKTIPNTKNFVFVNRYDVPVSGGKVEQHVNTYYYDQSKPSEKVELLFSAIPTDTTNKDASYPIIGSISPDRKYVSFNMFSCWNCGGHQPETMVVNLQTKAVKRIGETSYFKWNENGNYEYKEYITTPCPTPTGTEDFMQVNCPVEPSTLPLKTGSI